MTEKLSMSLTLIWSQYATGQGQQEVKVNKNLLLNSSPRGILLEIYIFTKA